MNFISRVRESGTFHSNLRSAICNLQLFFLAATVFPRVLIPQATKVSPVPYVIYGTVRLPDGSLARRVAVRVTGTTGLDRQTFTDDTGRYEFRELPRGRYSLSASNPNDPDQVSDYAEVEVGRAYTARILAHIYLRLRPGKTAKEVASSPVISAKEAAQRVPKQALKAFSQGIRFSHEGKLDRAEENFTRALNLFPDYFQALSERGSLRIAAGRMPEASEDFAHALEIDPEYGPALRGSGICKFQSGKYSDAMRDLEKAVAAEPNVARDFIFLGLVYAALDQREQARGAYERALILDPKGAARAHFHLASLYILESRPVEALDQLDAYLSAVPDAPDREKILALQSQLRRKH